MVVLARGDVEVASWPLAGCGRPDLALVDGLARLELAARRLGYSIRLHEACVELLELLDLCGLSEALLRLEPGRETESSEQVGVEEVVVPDDPVA